MKTRSKPTPPAKLSPEAVEWWGKLTAEFELDDAALLILGNAMQALDRIRQAQAIIAREGLVFRDRHEQPRVHPAVIIERDAKGTLLRCLRALNLDVEPLNDRPGRQPGR